MPTLRTYDAAGNYPQEMKGDYEEMKGIPLGGRGHEYGNFNGESRGGCNSPWNSELNGGQSTQGPLIEKLLSVTGSSGVST
jgi:hypothetical protein